MTGPLLVAHLTWPPQLQFTASQSHRGGWLGVGELVADHVTFDFVHGLGDLRIKAASKESHAHISLPTAMRDDLKLPVFCRLCFLRKMLAVGAAQRPSCPGHGSKRTTGTRGQLGSMISTRGRGPLVRSYSVDSFQPSSRKPLLSVQSP